MHQRRRLACRCFFRRLSSASWIRLGLKSSPSFGSDSWYGKRGFGGAGRPSRTSGQSLRLQGAEEALGSGADGWLAAGLTRQERTRQRSARA